MSRLKRAILVVGARPNYMKVAPLLCEMRSRGRWSELLLHTGQHYDHRMSQVFFDDLGLPEPDIFLGAGSGSHAEQYARVLIAFEQVLKKQRPDWVVVVGDVNSTLACALSAAQLQIPIAHVEAGLRSFDRSMPEEINRILTDQLADLLFTTEPSGNANLLREGISKEKIRFVGNTMIDTLTTMLPRAVDRPILKQLGLQVSGNGDGGSGCPNNAHSYVLVTLHRPANVDESAPLSEILSALEEIADERPVLFPVHPRTRQRIERNHLSVHSERVQLMEPLGYLDFIALMSNASLVITDSGGVQEESAYLSIPCLTIRPNTERPITIELGNNRLVERNRSSILKAARQSISGKKAPQGQVPPLWDGHAAVRIVDCLEQFPI